MYGVKTMRATQFLLLVFVIDLVPSLLHADGLIRKLPKDGTWAEYQIDCTIGEGETAWNESGVLRVASLGQVTKDGQACRWLEFAFIPKAEDAKASGPAKEKPTTDRKEIIKVLVPEKFLATGETPLEHILEAWEGRNPGHASKVPHPEDIEGGPLPLLLAGPLKDAKPLPKADVESKLGKVPCEGEKGVLDFKSREGRDFHFEIENRLHADSPFGVVRGEMNGGAPKSAKKPSLNIKWVLKLTDYGDNAKSQMPEEK